MKSAMDTEEHEMLKQVVDIITQKREKKLRRSFLHEQLVAEFVGTFFLVLGVTMAVASQHALGPLAVGAITAVMIYSFGSVSGAFFNPAVILAVILSGRRKLSPRVVVHYVLVELVAATAAAFATFAGTGKTFCFDYRQMPNGSWGASLELEVLFTMALCTVALNVGTSNDAPNQYFGFAIGCTVAASAVVSGGFNQSSFNPALTVGANLANFANGNSTINPCFKSWLIFLLAPLLGAVLAAMAFRATRGNEYEGVVAKEERKDADKDRSPTSTVTKIKEGELEEHV